VTYSLIVTEDLDIGPGTRSLRLQDGSVVTAHQLSVASLAILKTATLAAVNGASVLTLASFIPAGATVVGVTSKITTAFGASNGLTSFDVGESAVSDRWGHQTSLLSNALLEGGQFRAQGWPTYPSATDVLISAGGGTFDGNGVLECTLHYYLLSHRTAA